jgi:Family of unknown function (DUF6352)
LEPAVTLFTGTEFWLTSGFHLLKRNEAGRLKVTPEFLRAYITRPELQPDEHGDPAERDLAGRFLADPMQPIAPDRVACIADADLRHNWEAVLRFRDLLLNTDSLEEAYTRMATGTAGHIAPLFFDHLVHAILRGLLDRCMDPIRLRAAELLFRTQIVAIEGSTIRVGDEEMILAQSNGEVRLDLLTPEVGDQYWARSDRFDLALEVGFGSPGLDALCRVLESWIAHMTGLVGAIQPVQSIRDERWRWHIGLDATGSEILNELYRDVAVPEPRLALLLSLFRMELEPSPRLLPEMVGRPIYLGMAMTESGRLRLKPQNLLLNLPWQELPDK